MSDKPFRVLMDLTDLHIPSFKYVWISICPREIKTISDFKSSLLYKINLDKDNIKLFVRDGLLLDGETVLVLREDDTVKVQYKNYFSFQDFQDQATSATQELEKFSSKRDSRECNPKEYFNSKKRKRSNDFSATNENVVYPEESNSKTRKKNKKKHKSLSVASCDEEINSAVEPNIQSFVTHQNKKRKHNSSKQMNSSNSNLHSCNSNLFETESSLTKKCKNKTLDVDSNIEPFCSAVSKLKNILEKDEAINTKESEAINTKESEANQLEVDETDLKTSTECNTGLPNNCPKKKRKRRRKRKNIPEHVEVPLNSNDDKEFKSFINTHADFSKRKHVIFNTVNSHVGRLSEESLQVETMGTNGVTKVHNMSTDTYVVDDLSPSSFPKVSTPAQSNGCLNPNWHVSLMQNENFNHSYKKNCSSKKESASKHSITTFNARVSVENPEEKLSHEVKTSHYEDLPILHFQPKVGAHIAYKILELDDNYSPIVSEYREGIVKSINPLTEEMEIELLKHEIKPGRTGKFENLREDEIPLPEIKKTDVVVWPSLIEPKLLS